MTHSLIDTMSAEGRTHDRSEPSSPIPTCPKAMRSPSGGSRSSSFSGDCYSPRQSEIPRSHPRNNNNSGDDLRNYGGPPSTPGAGSRNRTFSGSDSGYDSCRSTPSLRYSRVYPYPPQGFRKRAISTHKNLQQKKEDFKLGAIIRCVHAEEAYNGGNHLSDQHKTVGPNGQTLCVKERPMIIIAQHANNWVALPMFTFQGRGIEKKPDPLEYVSIRDHRSTQPFQAQSAWDPLETEWLADEMSIFDQTSVARLTYTVCRDYTVPALIQGQLNAESTKKLIRLHRAYSAHGGRTDLEKGGNETPRVDKLIQETGLDPSQLERREKILVLIDRERKRSNSVASPR